MPAAVEGSFEPDVEHFQRQLDGDRAGADGDRVGVVVGPAEPGEFLVPADGAADAADLVGDDGFAVAAAAHDDGPVALALADCQGRRIDEVRIVARLRREGPEVLHLVALLDEVFLDPFLIVVPCVIRAQSNLHRNLTNRQLPNPQSNRREPPSQFPIRAVSPPRVVPSILPGDGFGALFGLDEEIAEGVEGVVVDAILERMVLTGGPMESQILSKIALINDSAGLSL